MQRGASLAYAGLSLLWGLVFLLIREVAVGFGWAATVSWGSLLIAVTIAALTWRRFELPANWRSLFMLGTGLAIQLVGLVLSVERLGVALAAVVVGAIPLFDTLAGQVLGRKRITGLGAAGLVLGFVGILLVVAFPAQGVSWDFIAGVLCGLFSAISGAFANSYAALRLPRANPPGVTAGAFLVAGLVTLPVSWLHPGTGDAGGLHWLGLILLGVVFGGVGFTLELRLRAARGPEHVGSARSLATILAVILGTVFAHDAVSAGQLVGMLLLIGGCSLVLGLTPRWFPSHWRR